MPGLLLCLGLLQLRGVGVKNLITCSTAEAVGGGRCLLLLWTRLISGNDVGPASLIYLLRFQQRLIRRTRRIQKRIP